MRRSLPFMLLFPRAIPGLIIGIGFFWTYLLVNPPGSALRNSIWGIMIALSIRSLTLAYFVMSSAFGTVSESMDSAARAAGASWWTATTRIAFPILKPALYASFILLFISILNDYDPALFLVTPGHEIMGVTMLDAEAAGHHRAGRRASHGAGRHHGPGHCDRRPAVRAESTRKPPCLRSPSSA